MQVLWHRASAGRSSGRDGEMWRIVTEQTSHTGQLELVLLRQGVGALEADRCRCTDCGRTPLTGEHMHLFEGRRSGLVCELCRIRRRDSPVASELVRHCEHGHAVRLTARAA